MDDKPKSKINKNAKRIFYLLIILFITLYFANKTGYYESRLQSKTNLTKEAIERFEKDVAEGKEVDINNYVDTSVKEYNNKYSSLGLGISTAIDKGVNKSIDFYFGALACNNYGIVSKSFNKAIINLDGIKTQHEIRNSNLYVGGIVYNNTVSPSSSRTYGKVLQCGNEGNIRIYAKTFVVGGVVASAHVNSSIEECYNKGNIEGFVTTTGNAISYVGGLVGHNQGIIKNSYSNAQNIIIDLNSQTRTLYVGGLVGYASNQNGIVINNCYSSTNNIQTLNSERGTAFIGLLVGYSNAQDTTKQTTSYYVQVSGMVVINNGPSGFSANSFSNSVDLLVSLNATDYVYAEGSEYPILQWEKEL